ncbi:hypothetical protein [Peptostreptococcus porci]|uniref:hypothetical protein n=1 Tax=Peptostreptococcus porci TaxID=2652282 RepID=UPI0023F1D0C0|nr:hypothetical protein [Peptostreptococcus porci]MDD7182355.1 hypothetical protein [Peptostreptococcus porci]
MKKLKKIFIAIAVLLVIGMIGSLFEKDDSSSKTNSNQNTSQESNDNADKKDYDYSTMQPNSEEFLNALKSQFETLEVKYIEDSGYVYIALDGTNALSGKSEAKRVALTGANILKKLSKNNSIKGVSINSRMETIDDKGNKSMDNVIQSSFTKEIIDSIDHDNWRQLLVQKNFYTKYYTTADTFLIYPSLQKEIPEEDLNNIYIK